MQKILSKANVWFWTFWAAVETWLTLWRRTLCGYYSPHSNVTENKKYCAFLRWITLNMQQIPNFILHSYQKIPPNLTLRQHVVKHGLSCFHSLLCSMSYFLWDNQVFLSFSGVCSSLMTKASWDRSLSMTSQLDALLRRRCVWSKLFSSLTSTEKVSYCHIVVQMFDTLIYGVCFTMS